MGHSSRWQRSNVSLALTALLMCACGGDDNVAGGAYSSTNDASHDVTGADDVSANDVTTGVDGTGAGDALEADAAGSVGPTGDDTRASTDDGRADGQTGNDTGAGTDDGGDGGSRDAMAGELPGDALADGGAGDATASGDAVDASGAEGGAPDAGGSDAGDDGGKDAAPDGMVEDASAIDAGGEAGCSTPQGGTFRCGAADCNGDTSFCVAGMLHDTCETLPAECACAETLTCACLLAHFKNPCDAGAVNCVPMHDGGLYWLETPVCP